MSYKTKWFLVLFSLLTAFTAFQSCSWLGEDDPVIVIHNSQLPYYTMLQDQKVDSIIADTYDHSYIEVVYYHNGEVSVFYDKFNIKNIILREAYRRYSYDYAPVLNRLRYEYSMKDLDYILFNSYLYQNHWPMLTRLDYFKEIRGPTQIHNKGSTITEVSVYLFLSLFSILLLVLFLRGMKLLFGKDDNKNNQKFPETKTNGKTNIRGIDNAGGLL